MRVNEVLKQPSSGERRTGLRRVITIDDVGHVEQTELTLGEDGTMYLRAMPEDNQAHGIGRLRPDLEPEGPVPSPDPEPEAEPEDDRPQ